MIKQFFKNKKGTATVEFSLTVGIFFFVVFLFFELARITLISSYLDLAVAESSRLARIDSYNHDYSKGHFDYQAAFTKHLNNGRFWKVINFGDENNNITIKVDYADSVDGLLADNFRSQLDPNTKQAKLDTRGAALAKYSVKYEYVNWIPLVPSAVANPIFHREFVVVQEYEK